MKLVRALFLSAALPMALVAQAPAGPPANPMATALKNREANLRRQIAQAFDSIPAAKFGYKPTPAQLTVGYIAQHVASDAYFFCNNFGEKKATVPEVDMKTADSVKAMWPKDSLVTKLKAAFAFCDDAATQLDDSNVGAIITVPGPNNTTRQVSRFNYVFGHAMDLQDHYSQLANYMRLNGMLPPSALPRPGRGGN